VEADISLSELDSRFDQTGPTLLFQTRCHWPVALPFFGVRQPDQGKRNFVIAITPFLPDDS
jgi:hypothetical protein